MSVRDRLCGYYQPELEVMTAERRREHQLNQLRAGAARACRASAATRAQFERAGLDPERIGGLEDLRSLPIVHKHDLPALQKGSPPFGGFNTVATESLGRIYASPGPIYDPEGREEDFWNLRQPFYAGGFRPGDIVQNTFSYHLTPAGLMCDHALRDLGCVVVPAGVGNTEIQAATMRDLEVTAYIGTPSFLMIILGKAREMGIEPRDLALEMAYLAGEMLAPSLRRTLEEEYGLHVRQGYITADLGAVGYECSEGNGFHVPEKVVVEILDPVDGTPKPPGEAGEVTVTTFKESYPLFRFATGDLSAFIEGRCACGRSSPRLRGVLGRADEVTKVRGMFIHPGMITEILERAAGGLPGQAVVTRQNHQDQLTIRVVTPAEGESLAAIVSSVEVTARDVLKLRVKVEKVTAEELGPRPRRIDDRRVWE